MTLRYEPGVFRSQFETPIGQELWQLLTDRDSMIRMETATSLGRPAVEGMEEELLLKFGEDVLDDRVKQMIGHMVRQIMEQSGFDVDAQNVKMTSGAPFSRATRYKRKDHAVFHVFRNSTNPRLIALTFDKAGSALPKIQHPPKSKWIYWKSFEGAIRGRVAFGLDDEKKAASEVKKKGYYMYEYSRLFRAGS